MAVDEAKLRVSVKELERNLRAVEHGIAQQRLEGLAVPQSTVEDLRRAARGEISNQDVRAYIEARFSNVPILQR